MSTSGNSLVFSTSAGLEIADATAAGTTLLLANGGSVGTVRPIMATIGGAVVFVTGQTYELAGNATSGFTQLWRTDGTTGGTSLIVHLPDNSSEAANPGVAGIGQLVSIGDRALFTYSDGDGSFGIWSTDGTAAGTFELPINTIYGIAGTAPLGSGTLLLTGDSLVLTDGTVAGTQDLTSSLPPNRFYSNLVAFNDGAAFQTYTVTGNVNVDNQIWTTDGTSAGTHMVMDFPSPGDTAAPGTLTALGNKLLFSYGSSDTGVATLWVSDGSSAGTQSLNVGGNLTGGLVVNNRYYTVGYQGMVVTDGTQAGTSILFASSGLPGERTYPAGDMAPLGNDVVFDAFNPGGSASLYVTDGTPAGTRLITSLPADNVPYGIEDFASTGSAVVFTYGTDTWVTDGTAAGTHRLFSGVAASGGSALLPVATPPIVPCFAAGTRVLTEQGEIAVEDLTVDDVVLTVSGARRAIQWIGYRRVDCRSHPNRDRALPVRIAPHAFGFGRPARPLMLSPDHSVFVEGVLIPIKFLLNGITVSQIEVDVIKYYHIELAQHDVIVAEGLPAETYLDTGSRDAFENSGASMQLHPNFEPDEARVGWMWSSFGYAPLLGQNGELDRVRAKLAVQAALLPDSDECVPSSESPGLRKKAS